MGAESDRPGWWPRPDKFLTTCVSNKPVGAFGSLLHDLPAFKIADLDAPIAWTEDLRAFNQHLDLAVLSEAFERMRPPRDLDNGSSLAPLLHRDPFGPLKFDLDLPPDDTDYRMHMYFPPPTMRPVFMPYVDDVVVPRLPKPRIKRVGGRSARRRGPEIVARWWDGALRGCETVRHDPDSGMWLVTNERGVHLGLVRYTRP